MRNVTKEDPAKQERQRGEKTPNATAGKLSTGIRLNLVNPVEKFIWNRSQESLLIPVPWFWVSDLFFFSGSGGARGPPQAGKLGRQAGEKLCQARNAPYEISAIV